MRRRNLFTALLALAMAGVAGTGFAAAPLNAPDSPAFRRAATLQRGVNLSGWFAQVSDASPGHFDTYTTPADLRFIREAGLQYVRLGLDPAKVFHYGLNSPDSAANLARVDIAVDQILQAHLAVQITVFPEADYKGQLDTEKGVDNLVLLWSFLARHFTNRDPERVFFELMNEPGVNDPYRWMGIQATLIDAIRKVDTAHTVIATAARYSGLDDLLLLQPVRDSNVIYNFHFYEPFPFTHQGASWGSSEWSYFHDIPYPATVDSLRTQLAAVPDDHARYLLYLYGAAGWNAATMLGRLQFAKDWASEHHVPIICNEFGAYKDTAPSDSRVRFLRDVRTDLERLGIGWAMWDYRGNFGMVTHQGTTIVPDGRVLEALGLRLP